MHTTHFSLRLLGTFEVLRDGRRVSDRCGGKMRALLAYVAVESAQPHSRQALATLLWPELDEEHARQSLRQALTSLRSALGDRTGPSSLFHISRDSVGLNPDSAHEIDIALLDAVAPSRCTPGVFSSRAACRQCHLVAAAHYRGSFLAGLSLADAPEFESWLQSKRQWFGYRAAESFGRLAACYEQSRDLQQALRYARAQLQVDPWNEEAHRQVMRLMVQGGQRGAAIAHYRHVSALLANELGIEPEEETRALYERARAGGIETAPGRLPVERLLQRDPSAARACSAAASGHGGERRVLTVLCCEAKCPPAEDAEDLHERASHALAAATEVIRQHGGEVMTSDGAGLTAYFGYPQSCDEPSLQAVRAALAVRDSLPGRRQLRLRVHSDIIFVPPRQQGSCESHAMIVGTAPRIARALQSASPHVDLVISGNTHALVRDAVECRTLAAHSLPDAAEPILMHEVIRTLCAPGWIVPPPADPASGLDTASLTRESGDPGALKWAERVGTMLDRLGQSKALVQLAACLGPAFSERQLAQVLSQVANLGLGPLMLAGELERLVGMGILQSAAEASVTRYRFREPLIREAVYHSQSRAQQRLYEKLLAAPGGK